MLNFMWNSCGIAWVYLLAKVRGLYTFPQPAIVKYVNLRISTLVFAHILCTLIHTLKSIFNLLIYVVHILNRPYNYYNLINKYVILLIYKLLDISHVYLKASQYIYRPTRKGLML